MMVRLPRISALLGAEIDDFGLEHVDRMIEGAVAEDTDLDFKAELYGATDADKREFAADVASFANTVGGLLLLGVAEIDGRASSVPGIPFSETEELRLRQVVASLVAPIPRFEIRRVAGQTGATGVYAVAVPKSFDAPHAVRVGESLRYPRRDGARKRFLSEQEVADAYRNRFLSMRERIERARSAMAEGMLRLARLADRAWIAAALVPDQPGFVRIDAASMRNLRAWEPLFAPVMGRAPLRAGGGLSFGVGIQRLTASAAEGADGRVVGDHVQLHSDGSGFAACSLHTRIDGDEPTGVIDEELVRAMAAMLRVLAHHAMRAGASGGASALATLLLPMRESPDGVPLRLLHARGGYREQITGTLIMNNPPAAEHSLDLDSLHQPQELMVATRIMLTDLLQAFGLPEVLQLTEDGALRKRYFMSENLRAVEDWAASNGVDLRDESVPF